LCQIDLVNHEIPHDTVMTSYLRPRCFRLERTGEAMPPHSAPPWEQLKSIQL